VLSQNGRIPPESGLLRAVVVGLAAAACDVGRGVVVSVPHGWGKSADRVARRASQGVTCAPGATPRLLCLLAVARRVFAPAERLVILGAGATVGENFGPDVVQMCRPPLNDDFFTQLQRITDKHTKIVRAVIKAEVRPEQFDAYQ
jgi:hypothetical protein